MTKKKWMAIGLTTAAIIGTCALTSLAAGAPDAPKDDTITAQFTVEDNGDVFDAAGNLIGNAAEYSASGTGAVLETTDNEGNPITVTVGPGMDGEGTSITSYSVCSTEGVAADVEGEAETFAAVTVEDNGDIFDAEGNRIGNISDYSADGSGHVFQMKDKDGNPIDVTVIETGETDGLTACTVTCTTTAG